MTEPTPHFDMPDYDNEQAEQFLRTLTNPQRWSRKFQPIDDTSKAAVIDAAIMLYDESVEKAYESAQKQESTLIRRKSEKIYRSEKERITRAIGYVANEPIEDMLSTYPHNHEMRREGPFMYVLEVAKKGAREIKRIHTSLPGPAASQAGEKDPSGLETSQGILLEVLEGYTDPEGIILHLYNDYEDRLDQEKAGALILLLELQRSSASPERQLNAIQNIQVDLEMRMKSLPTPDDKKGPQTTDPTLDKGVEYLKRIIGRPLGRRRVSGVRPRRLIEEVWQSEGRPALQVRVRDHVYSHVAYAIDRLYP